jgi:hypothetical protein
LETKNTRSSPSASREVSKSWIGFAAVEIEESEIRKKSRFSREESGDGDCRLGERPPGSRPVGDGFSYYYYYLFFSCLLFSLLLNNVK